MWDKQGIYRQIFNRKMISRNTTHGQSMNLQAMRTGETLKRLKQELIKQKIQDYSEWTTTEVATIKNWKIRLCQIIAFTRTSSMVKAIIWK